MAAISMGITFAELSRRQRRNCNAIQICINNSGLVLLVTDDLAEVLGLLLGDGCVSRYLYRGRFNFAVAFTASPSEFGYYETFVQPTIKTTFGIGGSLYLRRDNTTRYHIVSAKLASELAAMGIPVGRKHDAIIPPRVLESGKVVPFIRGLYHAEGSIYRRYSKRYSGHAKIYDNLMTIQIRMELRTLMSQITEELNKLGIVTNRLIESKGVYTLRITRQDMVRKFM